MNLFILILASLSWKPTLKITKIKLELLTDVNIILFYEKGIGGEITRVIYHYAEANNEYIPNYDKTKKKVHTLSIIILAINMDGLY